MAKGGVENANGRLRRWLPRHLDIDRTSDREIQEIVLTPNLTCDSEVRACHLRRQLGLGFPFPPTSFIKDFRGVLA
jgi:hypothetical protein